MAQSLSQPKIRTKQWRVVHVMVFHESLEDSPRPKSDSFVCSYTHQAKVRLIAKDDFLRKIAVHFLVFQHPINKFSAMHMVCWLEFLPHLNLVSMQMHIFYENLLHGASQNVQLL